MSLTIEVNNSNQKFLLLLQITSEEGQHFFDEDKRHQKNYGEIFLCGIFCFSLVFPLVLFFGEWRFLFSHFFFKSNFYFLKSTKSETYSTEGTVNLQRESKELLVTYEHVKCLSSVGLMISCHAIENFQLVKLIAVEICH